MYAIFSNISFSTHILTRRMTCPSPWKCTPVNFSTHILTRRMTCPSPWKCTPVNFSTHILTRRMTDGKREQESSSHFFNSHPHKEDDIFIITVFTLTSFSTHILTWRMTTPIPQVLVSHVFNSHPHKEDDQWNRERKVRHKLFQLTSSQGG